MKSYKLLWVALAFLPMCTYAQEQTDAQQADAQMQQRRAERRRNRIETPESRARMAAKNLKQEVQLTDEQYEKVFELYLKQENDRAQAMQNSGFGGGPMMGGPGGGMGGPGGGMGGPGGGMGGPGGGMGGPGMGGPGGGMGGPGMGAPDGEGGDRKMSEADIKKKMEEDQEKRAAEHKKMAKKMKKILDADQLAKWEEWDTKRMQPKMMPPRPEGGEKPEGAPEPPADMKEFTGDQF